MISADKPDRATLARFMATLWRALPGRLVLAFTLMLGASATEWIGVLMLVPMLALVGLDLGQGEVAGIARAVERAFGSVGLPVSLTAVLGVYVAIVAARTWLTRRDAIARARLEQELQHGLRIRLYRAITRLPWADFSRRRLSDLNHALTQEMDRVSTIVTGLLRLATDLLVTAVYFTIALYVSAIAALLALGSGLVLLFLLRRYNRRSRRAGQELGDASGAVLSAVQEHLGGLKTARSFGAEARNADAFAERSRRLAGTWIDAERHWGNASAWFSLGSVVVLAALVYVALDVLALSTAAILLLVFLFGRLVPRFSSLQSNYQLLVWALPAFTTVMTLTEECEARAEPVSDDAKLVRLNEAIRLDRVWFRYHEEGRPAIAGANLAIPARSTTAIVGASGAGKTTIADLLMGLLSPDAGRVVVDQTTLTPEHMHAWRQRIGYVAQDTFLLHDTIRANLLWARPGATDAQLWRALEHASADGFVSTLPAGLDTVVGDRGVLLSGGERQRLGLAAALLREPDLLILDEATSALDGTNERRILDAIRGLHGRVTTLIITHRLTAVRDADLVHVIEDGRVVESGSPSALFARRDSRFHGLCAAQGVSPSARTADTRELAAV